MTATAFAAPITRPATTAPRGRLRWAIERPTVSTPALTEGVEASRNNRIGTHLVDNGPLAADPAGTPAPDVMAALVRAGGPVRGAQPQRAGLEKLSAPLAESAADDRTFEGDLR